MDVSISPQPRICVTCAILPVGVRWSAEQAALPLRFVPRRRGGAPDVRILRTLGATVTGQTPPAEADIRVLLVDDHPLVRTALAEVLDDEDDLRIVGECGDGCEVVEATARLHPDVVCMDLTMPGMGGLAAPEALRSAGSDVRVVVLTAGPATGAEAAAAGANALVPKTGRPDALLRCLRALASGAPGCPYC